jgi:hypothetical protein
MKKIKGYLLLIILLIFNTRIVYAQHGEDEYLYQIVDDIENHDNFGYNQSIAHNSTLDCLQLIGIPDWFENYTTYTEVDDDGDLTVNDYQIEWSSMRRDTNASVSYDFGVDFFHDFTHEWILKIDDIEAGDVTGADFLGTGGVSDVRGSTADMITGDYIAVRMRQEADNDDLFRWYLLMRSGGVNVIQIVQPLGTNNPLDTYYLRLTRSGTNVTFYAYTDEARTVLNAKLTSNAGDDDDSYRYYNPLVSHNFAGDGADHSSGFVYNTSLGLGGFDNEGYIFGNNNLNGIGYTLVDLLNASIPANDIITVQYSSDNSTWVNTITLVDGLNSIELRGLNYTNLYRLINMTDGVADSTPRLFQVRLIYWNTTAPSGGVVSGNPNLGFIVTLFITIPAILILIINKRRRK